MKDFLSWLITSSADPEKTSLLIKGLLTVFAGNIAPLLPLVCSFLAALCFVDAGYLTQAIDVVVRVAWGILTIVGALMAGYGLRRKVQFGRWSAY